MIRKKSHCTFLPLDSKNQESEQIPGFWNPIEAQIPGFWKPMTGSWFLESNDRFLVFGIQW
jgi:hypothetical protein